MFIRKTTCAWIGVLVLSCMFLMGQESDWPAPDACTFVNCGANEICVGGNCVPCIYISGTIEENSVGVEGVKVFVSGDSGFEDIVYSESDGTYSVCVSTPGIYTVTVSQWGYTILDETREVTVPPSQQEVTGVDFEAISLSLPSLAEKYQDYFPIGFLIQSQDVLNAPGVITTHASMVTVQLYFRDVHPEENTYNFTTPDELIAFATSNGIAVRGHSLIGGNRTVNQADWLWVDENGVTVSREVLIERMRNHIQTVIGRYRGEVACWDVVNEAVDDNLFPSNQWRDIIGDEYIELAFGFAREADPDAVLFYNEYNLDWSDIKRLRTYEMLSDLVARGIPVDGIGLQGHWNSHGISSVSETEQTIDLFASLGLQIQITECEMSVYHPLRMVAPDLVPKRDTFTEPMAHGQADVYYELFSGYRSRGDSITGIIFWGISDDTSWLRYFPDQRLDWPLLFDGDYEPKYSFWAVVDF